MVATSAKPKEMSLSFLPATEVLADTGLRREWATVLSQSENINALYASPVWFEHLARLRTDASLQLGSVRDGSGALRSLCPVSIHPFTLKYDVWNRVLVKTRLRAAAILGSMPLVAGDAVQYHCIFDELFQTIPNCDCIYLESVATAGPLWDDLQGAGRATKEYVTYQPQGTRPWHCIDLHGTFADYSKTLSSKTRYKIRRYIRDLREQGNGALECRRVVAPEQVDEFLAGASQASRASWQHRVLGPRVDHTLKQSEGLKFLARNGVLRSYLLSCGSRPCAFVIGYQFQGVFHYAEVGFDETLAPFSPGTALLYLVIEDLYEHDKPEVFNFGTGDAAYKRRFANRERTDTAVILFRRTLTNHFRRASHGTFQSAVQWARRLLRHRLAEPTAKD